MRFSRRLTLKEQRGGVRWFLQAGLMIGLALALAHPALAAEPIFMWEADIDNDWNNAGNWAIWSNGHDSGPLTDPAPNPPTIVVGTIYDIARTTNVAPVIIAAGVAASANQLEVGRDIMRNPTGGTFNITGGSLTLGTDIFATYGKPGAEPVDAVVNQTGGTVTLGSKAAISAPVLAISAYAGGSSTYTLNGANAMLIGAQGNRIIAVNKGNSTTVRTYATFDHIQGTVKIGTVQVAAAYTNTTPTTAQNETAVYNLEEDGILQVDVAVNMGANDRSNNEATFNFHGGTLTRDFVSDPGGNTDLSLMKMANTAMDIIFQGYGTVDFGPGALTNNGKVIADSLGESARVLDMSCFATVNNTTESGPSADGWFAVNKGKLVLPSISVAAGSGTYNWGESSGDAAIDRTNSLRMTLANTSAGDATISLLAADYDGIQAGGKTFIGVWEFDDALSFSTADLSFRYDQQAAADAEIAEADLLLFSSNDGTSWTELEAAVNTTDMLIETQVSGGFAEFYAVGGVSTYLPGDADKNHTVDALDAAILAQYWLSGGANWSMGDFNGDGAVNDIDATMMATNWSSGGAASVPEPGILGMLAMCGLMLFYRWSRRRS